MKTMKRIGYAVRRADIDRPLFYDGYGIKDGAAVAHWSVVADVKRRTLAACLNLVDFIERTLCSRYPVEAVELWEDYEGRVAWCKIGDRPNEERK